MTEQDLIFGGITRRASLGLTTALFIVLGKIAGGGHPGFEMESEYSDVSTEPGFILAQKNLVDKNNLVPVVRRQTEELEKLAVLYNYKFTIYLDHPSNGGVIQFNSWRTSYDTPVQTSLASYNPSTGVVYHEYALPQDIAKLDEFKGKLLAVDQSITMSDEVNPVSRSFQYRFTKEGATDIVNIFSSFTNPETNVADNYSITMVHDGLEIVALYGSESILSNPNMINSAPFAPLVFRPSQ